jgi:hypothetical protein
MDGQTSVCFMALRTKTMINLEFSLLSLIKPTQVLTKHITCWLLCGGLLSSVPILACAAQSNSPEQPAAVESCSDQLTPSDDRYLGKVIQTQLVSLYQNNNDFQAQLKEDPKPLTDGIVGPRTRYWMDYFCGEFSFTAPEAPSNQHQQFVESLLIDLNRAAHLNALFPTWRTAIKPPELLRLTSAEIVQRLSLNTANIDKGINNDTSRSAHIKDLPDSDTAPYYYQLTEKDLASLTLRQTVLDSLAKLEKQQFDQRSQLYNQLSDLFSQLNIPIAPPLDLDNLIESHSIETNQPSASATTSTSTSQITNNGNKDAQATNKNSDGNNQGTHGDNNNPQTMNKNTNTNDKASDDNNIDINTGMDATNTSNQLVETNTQSNTETTAPQLVWQINAEELATTIKQLGITALPKDVLKTLSPLQDEVFPSLYLFDMALKLPGLSPANLEEKGVFTLARKSGPSPTYSVPMHWDTPPDCNCQDSLKSVFNMGTFYGFYPYWQHPIKDQTIDFSHLDRVGYVAAVMKPEGNGNTLVLPQNWLAAPEFSQFIQVTHRYRNKLDLVVTTPRNLSRKQLTALFTDEMVKRLVDTATAPMNKYFINKVQPWISFGLETPATMTDGITFDIDLAILDTPESQQAFFSFLHKLKAALRQSYQPQRRESELDFPAADSDRYYVNIVIPVIDLVAPTDNFYSFKNFYTLSQWSNLLVIRSSSPDTKDEKEDEITQIKELQQWLSRQTNQPEVQQVYKKIVPMLITEDNRNQTPALTQLVNLSSWSFTGAAYWPLPLDAINEQLIAKTFFSAAPQYPHPLNEILESISGLLNWVCIYRWELRTGLFVSFMFIILCLVICIWSFPLRKHLSRLPFVALTSASIIGLMLVFVADPAFKNYQGPILLVFVVVMGWILFAVRMVRKEGDKP